MVNAIPCIISRAAVEQKRNGGKRRTCNMQKSCQRVYFVANVVDKQNKCIHVLHRKERMTVLYRFNVKLFKCIAPAVKQRKETGKNYQMLFSRPG